MNEAQSPKTEGHAGSQRRHLLWVGAAAVGAGAVASWWRAGSAGSEAGPAGKPGAGAGAGAGAVAGGMADAGVANPQSVSDEQRLADDFWLRPMQRPDGSDLPLASWRGRPVLLNFWATWCPPCLREMPMLDAAAKRWSDSGLIILGLAVDSPGPVRSYLEKTPVSFPIGMAGAFGSALARQVGNKMGGLPYSVLCDRSGQIVQRHTGEMQAADVERWAQGLGLKG